MPDNLYNTLLKYINDPSDPDINYALGREYEKLGHTAGAISYLLRAAERTKDRLLTYECLVRIANCFDLQGNRQNTTRDMYRAAIAWMPERPEAYYLIAKRHERDSHWGESYMYAVLGHEMEMKQKNLKDLGVGFDPEWGLLFTKARSGWWLGKNGQSRRGLQYLIDRQFKNMNYYHQKLLEEKVIEFGSGSKDDIFRTYWKKDHENLRYKFPGSEKIERNYAQVYQDMFILSILDGKRNGTFLEVGGCDPHLGNNTATLEQDFNWKGVSIELDEKYAESYRKARPKTVLYNQDAITTDYRSLLKNHFDDKVIDYLQMDIDPPINTLKCLYEIPFDEYKFRIITYEHDYKTDMTREIKEKSREFLRSKGYKLVVDDVSHDGYWDFEDWWVHPDLVDPELVKKMMSVTGKTKSADDYIFAKSNEELIKTNSTKQDSKEIIIKAHQKYDSQLCWGWCSLDKSGAFIDYIDDVCSRVENPVCVEIGVFAGKSVLPVALELKRHNKGKLYAIDPWTSEEAGKGYENLGEEYIYWINVNLQEMYEFFMNLLKEYDVENYVDVIKTTSDDAPIIEDIDFLYIDGQHTEQAHRDVLKFATRVKLGGYCVADDVAWGEVKEVPNMLDALGFTHIHYLDTAYVYKRTKIVDFTKDDTDIFKNNKSVSKKAFDVDNFEDINILELNDTMETIEDIKTKIVDTYTDYDSKYGWGWSTLNKAGHLIDCTEEICTRVDNPICVEIGVYAGKSLLPIAMSLQRNKKGIVYGIDPWTNEEAIKGYSGVHEEYWNTINLQQKYEFFQQLITDFDLEKYVNTIVGASDDVPVIKNIDLLHIDGQHTEQAMRDAKKFASQVTLNGYCFVDDVAWGEVADVPYLLKDMGFVEVHRVDTGVMYKRNQIKELTNISSFSINSNFNKRSFVVDNFYADPLAIREFAQRQEYVQGGLGRGFIGRRTVQQFLFPGLKESFEQIMQKRITIWDEHGMNGRFQLNIAGEQLVYHCDSQKYAAMIYLTPNAPPSCGTSTFMHKKSRVYHNSDPRINEVFYGVKTTMDGTIHDRVDSFGNIFNRLVIFDAGLLHAASEYFGADMEDGRLWHMFFFDAE